MTGAVDLVNFGRNITAGIVMARGGLFLHSVLAVFGSVFRVGEPR